MVCTIIIKTSRSLTNGNRGRKFEDLRSLGLGFAFRSGRSEPSFKNDAVATLKGSARRCGYTKGTDERIDDKKGQQTFAQMGSEATPF